jgi:hypothetical protein
MDRLDESGLIYRRSFDAADLLDRFPPRLRDPNKQAVFRIACPSGSLPSGTVTVSRWGARSLPPALPRDGPQPALELREVLTCG